MQVESFLEQSAGRSPEKTAIVCGGTRFTYREVEERANRLARSLIAEGVERGERVAVYLDNSMQAVVSVFAILKAGAVFLVVNPTTKVDKLTYILDNCRAKGLIMPDRKFRAMQEGLANAQHLQRVWLAGSARDEEFPPHGRLIALDPILEGPNGAVEPPPKKCIDIDLAALIYTSGSTGRPKGVMLTHLNIVSPLPPSQRTSRTRPMTSSLIFCPCHSTMDCIKC